MADWIAISLRWTMLVGFTMSLGFGGKLELFTSLPLILLILWNLTMAALAGLNTRVPFHRQASVIMDIILVGAFYWMQGGLRAPAFWAGLLPILTGAIYFEIVGALVASVVFAVIIMYGGLQAPGDQTLAIIVSSSQVALGLLFGFISHSMSGSMRENREQVKNTQEKIVVSQAAIQSERMRAIYELTLEMTSTLSYKRVLESALNVSTSALNPDPERVKSDPLVGAVLLFRGDNLEVGSARRFTNADMRATFAAEDGVLKQAIEEGDAVHFTDIGNDPELGRVVAFRNCKSGYCFPLRSGFNIYGVLLFAHPEAEYFNAERRSLLDIIARQSVIAIQNARLYQDLIEEKERMTEVQEEARKKLARDLHDGPTQSVAAMAMRLNIIKRMLTKDVNAAGEEITKLEELAQRTTKEIRHMLFTLRPLILESQGLTAALKSMSDKMRETYNQNVTVSIDEKIVEQLEMGKQGVIFYIIEESVNNARKHASAETIAVRLRPVDNGIALLEIVDNGVGFDMKAMNEAYLKRANSSLGMVNLRERAEMINGFFQMDSVPGKGTKVQVYIPLSEEAADRMRNARKK
jgi:signal transduction histidine kinase